MLFSRLSMPEETCAVDVELASNLVSERLSAMVTSVLRNETGAGRENKCVHTNLLIPTKSSESFMDHLRALCQKENTCKFSALVFISS